MDGISRVLVVGAGTMGHGIAHVAAAAGCDVWLSDVDEAAANGGMDGIRSNLARGVDKGKVTADERDAVLARLTAVTSLDAAADADLVVEAVPENLEMKRDLFAKLDRLAAERAILATNTSSLPVGKIAAATARPSRVVGMHFFNPVHLMPLLEIVRADGTSDDTVDAVRELGVRMGKEPIVVRDMPGFATSRLGVLLGLEAIRMVEQEVASVEDIDKAMTLGYRHPMGPLRLTDLVGLDVRLAIAEHLHRELRSDAFLPPDLMRRMVADGRLGKKSGRGFYDWT
jgi:3-hydroxybutyryl-CoA dehydrogenase